ncbi:duf890 domain protein [Moniliophthora roreri MCA 2997]|uniref:Duf890 domain protein n=1 Tax=Moniliophthora roreri (strain MCA 2997) TaxID=1381753 RepID=V2XEX1_MONRO|nr:duf890 domain protein [Moniliophthora roreri MCA 2997]
MHSRNRYIQTPDFGQLAEAYPALKKFLKGATVDFKDPDAQRCITEALLQRDFNLKIQIPDDRLCPPVPNRLNYLLWIQDILRACPNTNEEVVGIDIGTGASVIYPLLGCRLEGSEIWRFIGTEIDELSYTSAKQNVESNNLAERITIVKIRAEADEPILAPLFTSSTSQRFAFTMCNPPFYASHEEMLHSAEAKELAPNAVCTGAPTELLTPGGEIAFITKMIHESTDQATRERCLWYTSMLGKLSSLGPIVDKLKEYGIDNYALTQFIQGQTKRWGVAWSFTDLRLPDAIARIQNPSITQYLPPRNTIRQSVPTPTTLDTVAHIVSSIGGSVSTARRVEYMIVEARGDTWSRAARRRQGKTEAVDSSQGVKMTCTIVVLETEKEKQVVFQWTKGRDRTLFESFSSHVCRKLMNAK